jgi:hypothetical protein
MFDQSTDLVAKAIAQDPYGEPYAGEAAFFERERRFRRQANDRSNP